MSKTICIFGDSIVHGVDDTKKGGWANRLMLFFWEDDNWDKYRTSLYPLGIDDDTTTKIRGRFDVEARSRQPDVIIFAIGINDSILVENNSEMISRIDFTSNIESLIKDAHKYTKDVIFIGLTPVIDNMLQPYEGNKYYSNERIRQFDKFIEQVCGDKDAHYISMSSVVDVEDLSDGLHPDSNSHEKMFEKVKEFLIENKLIS